MLVLCVAGLEGSAHCHCNMTLDKNLFDVISRDKCSLIDSVTRESFNTAADAAAHP